MSTLRHTLGLIVFVLALCNSLGGIIQRVAADPGGVSGSATVPYAPLKPYGVPLVQVNVDGKLTGTFVFDTGTNATAVTDSFASKLGLTPKPFLRDGKPYLVNGLPSRYVPITYLQIGNFRRNAQNSILVVDSHLMTTLIGRHVDGIIGVNAISQCAVLLDCSQHTITFSYPGKLSSQEVSQLKFSSSDGIPLTTLAKDTHYSVPVQFQNGAASGRESLIVDTGSYKTNISAALAKLLNLEAVGEHPYVEYNKASSSLEAKVDTIQLGQLNLTGQTVDFPPSSNADASRILGMDILSGYRVLMDFPANKMYIASPPTVAPPVRIAPSVPTQPAGDAKPTPVAPDAAAPKQP